MIKEKSILWATMTTNLGKFVAKLPISPNFITWLTLPTALLAFISIVAGHIALGLIIFIIAGVIDILDGPMARYLGISSGYGAFLDGSLDRVVDFLLLFSYFWIPLKMPWLTAGHWISLAVFFAIIPSFEVAYANHRRAVDDPDEKRIWRILNRGEMYFLMCLILLVAQYNARYAGYVLIFLVILSAITSVQTFLTTLYLSKKDEQLTAGDKL